MLNRLFLVVMCRLRRRLLWTRAHSTLNATDGFALFELFVLLQIEYYLVPGTRYRCLLWLIKNWVHLARAGTNLRTFSLVVTNQEDMMCRSMIKAKDYSTTHKCSLA